jgi:hypothetical protein
MASLYYKLTNAERCNRDFVLKDGMNEDNQFNPNLTIECTGGLYFCKAAHVLYWAHELKYTHVMTVQIPSNARVVQFADKARADKLILFNFRPIRAFVHELTPTERLAAIQQNGHAIQYLQTDERTALEVRLAAVCQNGDAIRHLKPAERAELEVRLPAVQQNGYAIQNTCSPPNARSWRCA